MAGIGVLRGSPTSLHRTLHGWRWNFERQGLCHKGRYDIENIYKARDAPVFDGKCLSRDSISLFTSFLICVGPLSEHSCAI